MLDAPSAWFNVMESGGNTFSFFSAISRPPPLEKTVTVRFEDQSVWARWLESYPPFVISPNLFQSKIYLEFGIPPHAKLWMVRLNAIVVDCPRFVSRVGLRAS